eukprot:scaffold695_cov196-Alexandrium_tamarense.AAC.20
MPSSKPRGSPLKFSAGGSKSASPHPSSSKQFRTSDAKANPQLPSQNIKPPSSSTPQSESNALTILQTGINIKRSPLQLKNWIACVLTLDGRDKFTKVLQYASRMLSWYFGVLGAGASVKGGTSEAILKQQLYLAISQRFQSLYKSLVDSRKAFRIGRSVIEMDKLKSMGWGEYLSYMMRHPLAGGVACGDRGMHFGNEATASKNGHVNSLHQYATHSIPEHHDEDDESGSWNEEEASDDELLGDDEEKKDDANGNVDKAIARPGRPVLPSRISSNIGWGPNTTAIASASSSTRKPSSKQLSHIPPPRTVSEMGRQMYRPFPSRSSSMGSYKQLKDSTQQLSVPIAPPTPAWKLVGGTLKLIGLMGFWAFDNVSFLTGTGFLDPIKFNANTNEVAKSSADSAYADRMRRRQYASEWATRFYFVGVMGGLYYTSRSLWQHRYGALKEARETLQGITSTQAKGDNDTEREEKARQALKKVEGKHFELFLALLKSVCDFMVFSNNPGVDFHLKLRGKKNHEGLHCLCGLTSASTVLYNNFPNAM